MSYASPNSELDKRHSEAKLDLACTAELRSTEFASQNWVYEKVTTAVVRILSMEECQWFHIDTKLEEFQSLEGSLEARKIHVGNRFLISFSHPHNIVLLTSCQTKSLHRSSAGRWGSTITELS
jgi:hypothetical protein